MGQVGNEIQESCGGYRKWCSGSRGCPHWPVTSFLPCDSGITRTRHACLLGMRQYSANNLLIPFLCLFLFFCSLVEAEAKKACEWLRATGFPQYAQLFEGKATQMLSLPCFQNLLSPAAFHLKKWVKHTPTAAAQKLLYILIGFVQGMNSGCSELYKIALISFYLWCQPHFRNQPLPPCSLSCSSCCFVSFLNTR